MDKVTVVTVCYNAQNEIVPTIESVLMQDYPDIEYVIVDGKSKDNTLGVIESYKNSFADSGNITLKVVSEKDSGIYDAMNKGTDIAEGKWLIFMNAGDSFYNKSVISDVFSGQPYTEYSAVFGDTRRFVDDWETVVKGQPLENIKESIPLPFCHQSIFILTDIMKKLRYNTDYRQAADYDFFCRCYLEGCKFLHRDVIVSNYDMCGISATNTVYHLKEKIKIRQANGLEKYSKLKKWYMIMRLDMRQKIKGIMPKGLLKKIRGY